jgi:hypothetical protein
VQPPPQRHERDEKLLVGLLYEVNRCRDHVRAGRESRLTQVTRNEQSQRCVRLAEAMKAYADAAADSGVPLPYRYRDEMRLYRAMADGRSDAASS